MSCIKRRRVSVGYSTLSVAGRDKDILIPASTESSTPAAAALSSYGTVSGITVRRRLDDSLDLIFFCNDYYCYYYYYYY